MSDREYVARMVTIACLVVVAVGLIWFVYDSEPAVADTRIVESTMTSGNVTNAENLRIAEEKRKIREKKLEMIVSILEALGEAAEALGDAD